MISFLDLYTPVCSYRNSYQRITLICWTDALIILRDFDSNNLRNFQPSLEDEPGQPLMFKHIQSITTHKLFIFTSLPLELTWPYCSKTWINPRKKRKNRGGQRAPAPAYYNFLFSIPSPPPPPKKTCPYLKTNSLPVHLPFLRFFSQETGGGRRRLPSLVNFHPDATL